MFPLEEQLEKPKPRCEHEAWDTQKDFGTFGNGRVPGSMSGIGAVVNQPITEALPSSELSSVVQGTASEATLLKGW